MAAFALILFSLLSRVLGSETTIKSMQEWEASTVTVTAPAMTSCSCPSAPPCPAPSYQTTGDFLVVPGLSSSITYSLVSSQPTTASESTFVKALTPTLPSSGTLTQVKESHGTDSPSTLALTVPSEEASVSVIVVTETLYATSSFAVTDCGSEYPECHTSTMTSLVPSVTNKISYSTSRLSDTSPTKSTQPLLISTLSTSELETKVLTTWVTKTETSTSLSTITSCAPGADTCFTGQVQTSHIPTVTISKSYSTTIVSSVVPKASFSSTTESEFTISKPISTTFVSSVGPGTLSSSTAEIEFTTDTSVVWVTNTEFSTSLHTVTNCAGVPSCTEGATWTSNIPIIVTSSTATTVVKPVTSTPSPESIMTSSVSVSMPSNQSLTESSRTSLTTSTLYSTRVHTVNGCASGVRSCPATSTKVVTSVIAIGTTVCPIVGSDSFTSVATTTSARYWNSTVSSGHGHHTHPASVATISQSIISKNYSTSTSSSNSTVYQSTATLFTTPIWSSGISPSGSLVPSSSYFSVPPMYPNTTSSTPTIPLSTYLSSSTLPSLSFSSQILNTSVSGNSSTMTKPTMSLYTFSQSSTSVSSDSATVPYQYTNSTRVSSTSSGPTAPLYTGSASSSPTLSLNTTTFSAWSMEYSTNTPNSYTDSTPSSSLQVTTSQDHESVITTAPSEVTESTTRTSTTRLDNTAWTDTESHTGPAEFTHPPNLPDHDAPSSWGPSSSAPTWEKASLTAKVTGW